MTREMKNSGVEWIGDIPSEWKVENLQWNMNEIIEKNSPIKITSVLSLTKEKGVIPYEDKGNQGNKSKESIEDYKIAYKGTIVANSMNILIGSVGISNYDGCVSPVYYVFKNNNKTDLGFLNYIFTTEQFQKQLRKYANGILEIRLRVSSENIMKQKVMFPPLSEQKKIADFLDSKVTEIDKIISETKASIENYKEYKQSVITEAVTKGLDKNVSMKEANNTYLGFVPFEWREKRLRFLGLCQNGISKSIDFFGKGYPFVAYGDVSKNISLPESVAGLIDTNENEREIYSVRYGDVFFTRTSETIEEVGFASTCLKTIENAVFAGFVIRFRPFNQYELLPGFSKYYFRSNIHRKFFVKEMNLVTRASLSQELLKKLPVLLPPLNEQKRISNFLDNKCAEIDNLILEKEKFVTNLEGYKKSLIYEYVTGKKVV